MSQFKNTTNHTISIIVNGSRKNVKPNEVVSGPDSLDAIPGLTMLKNNYQTEVLNNKFSMIPNKTILNQPPLTTYSNVNLSSDIDTELKYLKKMKDLNRNPSVTIAILTKNSLGLITNCCESILSMVNYQNVTIMVIDTGTTDNDVRLYYDTLSSKCSQKNWKYKFVQLGYFFYGKNYNEALRQVDTDYVLIQNNDTVALNDYVTEMMGTAVLRRVGSTGCRMVYPDQVSIQHDGQSLFNAPGGMFGGPGHVNLRVPVSSTPEPKTDFVDGNTAAGVLMRMSEYTTVRGFDERYQDIFQDVDLMMKIPHILNKFNYCNKIAKIIHIDNATRLQKGHDPKRHAQMIADSNLLGEQLVKNNWQRIKKPSTYDFSIITLVRDLDSYTDLLNSLKSQLGNYTVEIIGIPNFYNQFTSTFKALNTAADTANGKYLIFCHDDIIVTHDWLDKIQININAFSIQGINWGVLGPAGITPTNQSAFYLIDENGKAIKDSQSVDTNVPYYEVVSLDELCLITKKENNLRFSDKELDGFHFYGTNICLVANMRGMKNYSINAYCHHKSDGYKNISSLDNFMKYKKLAEKFNNWTKQRNINKWRSTTAMSENDNLMFFVNGPTE